MKKQVVVEQIEGYRKEAIEARKTQNYEFAFLLLDKADSLERQLELETLNT